MKNLLGHSVCRDNHGCCYTDSFIRLLYWDTIKPDIALDMVVNDETYTLSSEARPSVSCLQCRCFSYSVLRQT